MDESCLYEARIVAQEVGEDGQKLLKNHAIWGMINTLQSTSAEPRQLIADGENVSKKGGSRKRCKTASISCSVN